MKKKIKYIILGLVVVLGCYLYAHVDKTHDVYNSEIDSSLYLSAVLTENQSVSQRFMCQEERLDGIAVKLSTNSASQEGKLLYTLNDVDGHELISGELFFNEIKSGRINKIKFEENIEGSKDKEYMVTIKVSGLNEGESLSVYYTREEDSDIIINEKETNGAMILRTVTHRFDIETFVVVIGIFIYFVVFFKILYKLFS